MTRLQLEGPTISDLLTQIRSEYGPNARIVAAERVRTGGIAGFFAKQHFEVALEVPDHADGPDHAELRDSTASADSIASAVPQPREPQTTASERSEPPVAATLGDDAAETRTFEARTSEAGAVEASAGKASAGKASAGEASAGEASAPENPLAGLIAAAELGDGEPDADGKPDPERQGHTADAFADALRQARERAAGLPDPAEPEPAEPEPVEPEPVEPEPVEPEPVGPPSAPRPGAHLRPAPWLRTPEPSGNQPEPTGDQPEPTGDPGSGGLWLTRSRLHDLGLPDSVLAALPAQPSPADLAAAVADLPHLPPLHPSQADVTALVGEPSHVDVLATTLSHRWHLSQVRTEIDEAADASASAPRASGRRLAVLPAQFTAEDAAWAGHELAQLDVDLVLLVVDATRNMDDVAHWMRDLSPDGLILVNSSGSSRPAAALGLNLPVVELDGRPTNAREWAGLLMARCLGDLR